MQSEAEPCIAQPPRCTFLTVATACLYIATWQPADIEIQSSACDKRRCWSCFQTPRLVVGLLRLKFFKGQR